MGDVGASLVGVAIVLRKMPSSSIVLFHGFVRLLYDELKDMDLSSLKKYACTHGSMYEELNPQQIKPLYEVVNRSLGNLFRSLIGNKPR